MSDIADTAEVSIEMIEQAGVAQAHENVLSMPTGSPGDCGRCGEPSARLVAGVCAPCRDRYHLP